MSLETQSYSYIGLSTISHPKKPPHTLYDNTSSLPLSPQFLANGIPQILPYIPSPDTLKKWKPSIFQFVRAGHVHNRSLVVSTKDEWGRSKPLRVIFGDEFGNWYSELNTKGNVFTIPEGRITVTDLNPQGTIDAWGTYNKDLLDRAISASRVFRELGIDAEYVLYAEQVDQFLHPETGKTVAVDQIRTFAKTHLQIHDSEEVSTEAREKFENLEFVTLLRGVKVSHRLNDIRDIISSSEDIQSFFSRLISLHNFDCERKEKQGTKVPGIHEKLGPYELERYISEILPKRLGHNVGLMHNAGIIHRFLHLGNLSLLGEIMDLDSPVGKLIDPHDNGPQGIHNFALDLWYFLSSTAIKDLIEPLKNGYPDPHVFNRNIPQLIRTFAQSFIEQYGQTRNVKKDSIEELQLKLFDAVVHMQSRQEQLPSFSLPQGLGRILDDNPDLFKPTFINQLISAFGNVDVSTPAATFITLMDTVSVRLEEKAINSITSTLARALHTSAEEVVLKMKKEKIHKSEGMHVMFIHFQALVYTYVSRLEEHMKRRKSFKQLSEHEQQKTLRIFRLCMVGRFGITGYSHFRTALMSEIPFTEKVAHKIPLLIQPML